MTTMSSLVSRLLPQARLLQRSAAAAASELHTSAPALGSLAMPDRLKHIPEAEDPGFFEMVEYFFHKSCILAEDKLIDVDMKNMRASREEKMAKAHGILKIIEPCAHVLEVNFPLQRDDGSYEMINGYRAQHSHHRYTGDITQYTIYSQATNIPSSILHFNFDPLFPAGARAREVSATPPMCARTR